MKKNILFLLLLCPLFFTQLAAQVALDHDTVYAEITVDNYFDCVNHNFVTNSLSDATTYIWVKKELVMPAGWDAAVCDPYQCYFHTVDSITFNLAANEKGIMDVHVYPDPNNWVGGYAVVEVTVKEVGNESNTTSGIYIFESEATSTHEAQQIEFKVFPNPTSGLFAIEGETEEVANMTIFSTIGQRLLQMPVQGGDWYNVSNLTAGTYLVQLSAEDGRLLGTKLITKY